MNNEPTGWIMEEDLKKMEKGAVVQFVYRCQQFSMQDNKPKKQIALYTHPVKELFKDAENRDELIGQEFETYLEKLTQDFKEGFKEGVLFCEDVAKRPALYGQDTNPVKELTDRIAELENALESIDIYLSDTLSGRAEPDPSTYKQWLIDGVREARNRARAILRKASEK